MIKQVKEFFDNFEDSNIELSERIKREINDLPPKDGSKRRVVKSINKVKNI